MTITLFQSRNRRSYKVNPLVTAQTGTIYEVTDRIDAGGNAVVHRCVHTTSGDEFAVKFQLSLHQKRQKRFEQEIKLLSEAEHEQLIRYVDHGTVTSNCGTIIPFLIMELAESNLVDYLQGLTTGQLLYEEYIGQFRGLANALSELHKKAIHRDIKPENILVQGDKWMLSDFGICKYLDGDQSLDLTEEEENVGPKYWMSPESMNRTLGNTDSISTQSDVFQLCTVFWFIATGRHPTGIVSQTDWTGPTSIFQILCDAMSHDPGKRPKDGEALAGLLDSVILP